MNGAERAQNLLDGGFTPEEVQGWSARKRLKLERGGFSRDEIETFFGNPPVDKEAFRAAIEPPMARAAAESDGEFTLEDAFVAAWQQSIFGLGEREKVPDLVVPSDAGRLLRIVSQATTLGLDIPFFAAGFGIGAGTFSPTGPGAFVAGTAASFALPTALRTVMMNTYEKGQVKSFGEFWDLSVTTVVDTAKAYVTGAAVGGTGVVGAALKAPGLITGSAQVVAAVNVGATL